MAVPAPGDIVAPSTDFPFPQFPTVFADGVLNFANTEQIAKFYLYRMEPSFSGTKNQMHPFMQVVMSLEGFQIAYAFFHNAVEKLIQEKVLTREKLEEFIKGTKA